MVAGRRALLAAAEDEARLREDEATGISRSSSSSDEDESPTAAEELEAPRVMVEDPCVLNTADRRGGGSGEVDGVASLLRWNECASAGREREGTGGGWRTARGAAATRWIFGEDDGKGGAGIGRGLAD